MSVPLLQICHLPFTLFSTLLILKWAWKQLRLPGWGANLHNISGINLSRPAQKPAALPFCCVLSACQKSLVFPHFWYWQVPAPRGLSGGGLKLQVTLSCTFLLDSNVLEHTIMFDLIISSSINYLSYPLGVLRASFLLPSPPPWWFSPKSAVGQGEMGEGWKRKTCSLSLWICVLVCSSDAE